MLINNLLQILQVIYYGLKILKELEDYKKKYIDKNKKQNFILKITPQSQIKVQSIYCPH